jgi:hypothetical protein
MTMLGYNGFEPYTRRRPNIAVAVLIGAGVLALLWLLRSPTGALPLLLVGGGLTWLAFRNHSRPLLVPGSLLLGLAVGSIAAALLGQISGGYGAAAILSGLGAAFLALPTLDRMRTRNPYNIAFGWSRLPGLILLGIAAIFAALGTVSVAFKALGLAFHFWPLVLLAIIGLLIYRRRRRTRARRA